MDELGVTVLKLKSLNSVDELRVDELETTYPMRTHRRFGVLQLQVNRDSVHLLSGQTG